MTIASRVGALVAILVVGISMPAKADLVKELIPTGKLRVAIAVAPAPSALYAVKDGTTGKFRGVTVDLGAALARKLGVPVEFLPHLASGEIQNSAASGKWDVTFMPVDEERKKVVDFGNAYHLLQSTYLVAPGSKLAKVEDANAQGVRIGGVANTATFRAAQRTAPKATFVTVAGRPRLRQRLHRRGESEWPHPQGVRRHEPAKLPGRAGRDETLSTAC
jgi:polar amino acid transport system substrate-binding protein